MGGRCRGWDSIAHGFAVEPFGYCRGARGADVSDAVEATSGDEGLSMTELYAVAESLGRDPSRGHGAPTPKRTSSRASRDFGGLLSAPTPTARTWSSRRRSRPARTTTCSPGWSTRPRSSSRTTTELKLYVECTPGLNVQIAVIYYDEAEKRIGSSVHFANQNAVSNPRRRTDAAGSAPGGGRRDGRAAKRGVRPPLGDPGLHAVAGRRSSADERVPVERRAVPERVRPLARAGLCPCGVRVDVLTVQAGQTYRTYEHEGVDVAVGSPEVLDMALRSKARTT